jgi:outer membrane protein, multidrug efflux system
MSPMRRNLQATVTKTRKAVRRSRKCWWRFTFVAAHVGLSACTTFHPLGPDYHKPDLLVAPDFPDESSSKSADTDPNAPPTSQTPEGMIPPVVPAPVPAAWWKMYDDRNVNELVDEALRANPDLRQAASTLAAAQSRLDEARAAWLPSTAVSTSFTRERGNVYGERGLHRFDLASINLGVSYEVDLFGRIRRLEEGASATYDAQTFAFGAAQVQLVASTIDAYLLSCRSNAVLANAHDELRIARRQYELTERLHAHGAAGTIDVLQAKTQVETQAATMPNLQAARQAALYSLATLLGRSPVDFPASAASCQAPPRIKQSLPVGDGLGMLRRRPDVAEAERQLAATTAQIGVAMAQLYPKVTLGIGVGGLGSTPGGALEPSGRTWQLGPMVQWQFPNVAVALAEENGQESSARAALSHYDSVVLNALKETDTALDAYERALEYEAALAHTEDTNAALVDETERLYASGALSYLNLLDAQRSLFAVRMERISAEANVSRAQVALFEALGGGWEDSATSASVADRDALRRFDKAVAARSTSSQ